MGSKLFTGGSGSHGEYSGCCRCDLIWLLRLRLVDGKRYQKFSAPPGFALDLNASPMILYDATRERQSQSRSVSLGRVKRAKDEGEVLRGDAPAAVGYRD